MYDSRVAALGQRMAHTMIFRAP